MDIEMPGISGIEATFRVKEGFPEIDITMFTVFEDDDRIFDAIKAGASGYLLKDEPVEMVVESMKELKIGGAPMTPNIAKKLLLLIRSDRVSKNRETTVSDEIPNDLSAR